MGVKSGFGQCPKCEKFSMVVVEARSERGITLDFYCVGCGFTKEKKFD